LYEESDILADLPSCMRIDVAMYLHRELIEAVSSSHSSLLITSHHHHNSATVTHVCTFRSSFGVVGAQAPFLRDCNKDAVAQLVLHLRPMQATPGQWICHKGDIGLEMWFITKGRLDVVDETLPPMRDVIVTLKKGDYVGEFALLARGTHVSRRSSSLRSRGYCELYTLTKDDFEHVIGMVPEVRVWCVPHTLTRRHMRSSVCGCVVADVLHVTFRVQIYERMHAAALEKLQATQAKQRGASFRMATALLQPRDRDTPLLAVLAQAATPSAASQKPKNSWQRRGVTAKRVLKSIGRRLSRSHRPADNQSNSKPEAPPHTTDQPAAAPRAPRAAADVTSTVLDSARPAVAAPNAHIDVDPSAVARALDQGPAGAPSGSSLTPPRESGLQHLRRSGAQALASGPASMLSIQPESVGLPDTGGNDDPVNRDGDDPTPALHVNPMATPTRLRISSFRITSKGQPSGRTTPRPTPFDTLTSPSNDRGNNDRDAGAGTAAAAAADSTAADIAAATAATAAATATATASAEVVGSAQVAVHQRMAMGVPKRRSSVGEACSKAVRSPSFRITSRSSAAGAVATVVRGPLTATPMAVAAPAPDAVSTPTATPEGVSLSLLWRQQQELAAGLTAIMARLDKLSQQS